MFKMFSTFNVLFIITTTTLAISETALVDTFKKCTLDDEKCLKDFYQSLIQTLAKDGAPELDINKIDPVELHTDSVSILNILNMTLLDGKAEGVKTCNVKSFQNNIKQRKASLHIICDKITIFGNYEVQLFVPLLATSNVNGENDHGKGSGRINIEKVDIHLEYPFTLEKQNDGVHFKLNTANIQYNIDILKKATFQTDDLIIGDQEFSRVIINYMNDNWKIVMQTFGNFFFGKAIEYINIYSSKVFNSVPAEHFIIEDLTPYLK